MATSDSCTQNSCWCFYCLRKYISLLLLAEKQLIAACTDVFSAGAETGSATVAFSVMLMCLFPEVRRKVQKEIDSVVGQNRFPSMADRMK